MKEKLISPSADEDARIARGIAGRSRRGAGFVDARRRRRQARGAPPPKSDRKVLVTLRLDRDIVERFKPPPLVGRPASMRR